jgi:hypothetical protein
MSLPLPIQFKRQYAGPIDVDTVFDTTADRIAYLTNPRRYAGQAIYDKQEDAYYYVNATRDNYNPFGGTVAGTGPTTINLLASNGAEQTILIAAGSLLEVIAVLSTVAVTIGIGKASGQTDVMDATALNVGNNYTYTLSWVNYTKNNLTLYISGITQNITLKIYKR